MALIDYANIHHTHDIRGKVGLPSGFGFYRFGISHFGYYEPFAGVYQKHKYKKGWSISRMRYARPTNPQTLAQQTWRAVFASCNSEWPNLTDEQRQAYNKKAKAIRKNDGHQLFMSECLKSNLP